MIGGASFAHHGVQADFILDRQDDFSGLALKLWNTMKNDLIWNTGKKLGQITFASRFERVCLQAADLVAFCLHHVEAYRRGTDRPDVAYALHHIGKRLHVKKLDRESVRLLLPAYPQELKEQDRRAEEAESGKTSLLKTSL